MCELRLFGPLEYALIITGTAYPRGYRVGKNFPRLRREFLLYGTLTFVGVVALCWFRLAPALLIFVLPMIIALMFTAWVTHDHHAGLGTGDQFEDRKSTRLNSSHALISYAVFCLKKKTNK